MRRWIGLLAMGICSVQAFAAEQLIRLESVQVTGVTIFQEEAIESAMELGPGDLLDRAKVVHTEENLQKLYRIHGYEQVGIQSRLLKKSILEIHVDEGRPTRIAAVDFVPSWANPEPEVSRASKDAWQKAKLALASGVGLRESDIFDEEKVNVSKRSVQDVLISQEYVGAKIDELRATTVEAPANATDLQKGDRWVRLQFVIRLGDRVTFGFRGNTSIASTRLSSVVDEQRALGLGQDFVAVIAARLQDEYRSIGYANAKVTAYSFENQKSEERHVTYEIDEGRRVEIDDLQFDGNLVFSQKELADKFYEVASPLVQRRHFVDKDVQKAAELVIEWMKSRGYLGAKLVTINHSFVDRKREDEKDTRVRLIIYLYESEQTVVQSLKIVGATVFTEAEIEKFLKTKEGDPLNVFAFSEGIEAFKAAYRAKGYLSAMIENEGTDKIIHYSDENRLADITLNIHEGKQYRVGNILIEGRQKTQEKVIRREFAFKEGKILEEPKIAETETNLRRLGIFSAVRITTLDDPENTDLKIIKVVVEEADPGVIAGGPGFRNDLGMRAFGEIGYNNLWGLDHSLFLNGAVNRRVDSTYRFVEYQTQISYSWPWFEGLGVTFRPTLSLSGTEYLNFDAVTADLALTWEKRLLTKPNLVASFTYDIERVNQFHAQDVIDDGFFRIGSVMPALKLDMRDNPLAPTTGLFAQISLEIADPILLSQRAGSNSPSPIGYDRLLFRGDYTIPLAPMVSWYLSFRSGFEKSTVSVPGRTDGYGAIPLIKQFALGGVGSLRGYSDEELNEYNESITGTLSYVDYRTQMDFPLSGGLRFGPFLDAANLRVDSFSFGGLLYGTGFGFHYLTPVGPVNLDWGFKLNAPSGADTSQFYFSIGVL